MKLLAPEAQSSIPSEIPVSGNNNHYSTVKKTLNHDIRCGISFFIKGFPSDVECIMMNENYQNIMFFITF